MWNGELTRIEDGVWRVEARLNGVHVSLYILRGERLAIVDTGYRFHPEQVIVPALRELGFDLDDVDLIVNTHGHPDHLGGNAVLRSKTGAKTCMHRGDAGLAGGPEAHIRSLTDHITAMRALGWDAQVAEREAFLRERVEACAIDRELRANDIVGLGDGLDLEVVPTPGHTPGSVILLARSRKLAFAGDAVQGWGVAPGIVPLYYDPKVYRQSLSVLASLEIETLCLAHDFQWSGHGSSAGSVRRGGEVGISLADSGAFVDVLEQLALASDPAALLGQRVTWIARTLPPPYKVHVRKDGTFSASCAATIISQLGAMDRRVPSVAGRGRNGHAGT
jgi:glyoxylase-like metal-dependent hydrolase (beta-lactamase superfamily II)